MPGRRISVKLGSLFYVAAPNRLALSPFFRGSASGETGETRLKDCAFFGTWVELVDIVPVG
jgi:hypothetical protein